MKFRIPHFILLSSIYLFAAGCQSYIPYQGDTIFTSTSQEPCLGRESEIQIFPSSAQLDFNYQKIGLIELNLGPNSNKEIKIDRLKYEAWKNCANAVIHVSTDYNYGLAIRIEKDARFFVGYPENLDSSFNSQINNPDLIENISGMEIEEEDEDAYAGIQAFFLLLGIILIPFLIAGEDEDDI